MIKYITRDRGSYYFSDVIWSCLNLKAEELSASDLARYSDYAIDSKGTLIKHRIPIEQLLDAALLD